MRTVFEEEEEETASSDPGQDREVTIGATTLLAIFFGLVLICGLFFGLGYTVGRRAPSEAAQLPAETPAPSSGALQSLDNQPKPSAASQPVPAPAADEPQPSTAASSADAPESASGSAVATEPQVVSNQPKTPAATPVNATPSQVKPALISAPQQAATPKSAPNPASAVPAAVAAALPVTAAATTPAPGIMVQIAAISNPADANVLVGALQKRGYAVTARHLPGDSLIHVQAGPFASRAEANATKQKLLSDGYNAFLR